MKVTVIVPSYNCAKTIATQLDALAQQDDSDPFEIIVADNGSTDQTVTIVQAYQQRMPHLRYVDASAHRGSSHARNCAANVAQGEFLLFCDADDEVAPGWITAMVQALSQHDFVAGVHDYQKLNHPQTVALFSAIEGCGVINSAYLPFSGTNNLGIKRSIHQAIGGFDEALYGSQDVDYCWRVQEAGFTLHEATDALVHFRFRPRVIDNFSRWQRFGYHSVRLYRKHLPLGLSPWLIGKGFLATIVLPVRFLLQVRDQASLVRWILTCGWCIGYLRGWFGWMVVSR
jgi:glycosyltransferase involved in cell wall biosynthesis